jgi:formamidopyrimidine-DNA glycosylase
MPELPEVETVRRGLAPAMKGRIITQLMLNRPDLRFPFPEAMAERLQGQMITRVRRRAKFLLVDCAHGMSILMHLGMSGAFRIVRPTGAQDQTGTQSITTEPGDFAFARSKQSVHDHVIFELSDATRIIYNDPRRFGFMDLARTTELGLHRFLASLGPEPWEVSADELAHVLQKQTRPIKAALLDQRLIAGLGNIYVCEALYRAGLSPHRAVHTLVTGRGRATFGLKMLVDKMKTVLEEAIEAGGSSLRDHTKADGTMGYFQHSFQVYGRDNQPCLKEGCRGNIKRTVQAGRSSFFCSHCQK